MTFFVSDSAMTNPGNAPYVPNLTRNLYMNFNASIDAPNNNASVESLMFRGNAPLLDRTFNKKRGALLNYPASVAGSESYLKFNGAAAIANSNDNGGTGAYRTLENNISIAMRMRVNNWTNPAGGTAGFIRGVSNRSASIRSGSANSPGSMSLTGGPAQAGVSPTTTTVQTDLGTGSWAVVVVVYSPGGNKILAGQAATPALFSMPSGTNLQGFGFGSTTNNSITEAANFDLSHFALWDRALTVDEMILARDIWEAGRDFQL